MAGLPHDHEKSNLTAKDKVIVYMFMLIIQILAPWKYSHEFKEAMGDIKDLLKGGTNAGSK